MKLSVAKALLVCSAAPVALVFAWPVWAQDQQTTDQAGGAGQTDAKDDAPADADSETYSDADIVVRAIRPKGEVDTDIPVLDELSAEDVAGYGASSIDELIELLGPQTGSARGRGGGRPVILLNGRRISSFRELRDLPPEAIARVQIFPEELALQYGYRPDQRVINLILVDNYASVIGELEYGQPTGGGKSKQETQLGLTRIGDDFRLNLNAEYTHESALTEAERDIVQPPSGADVLLPAALSDIGEYRTLLPETDAWQLNGSYSRNLSETVTLALNAAYELQDSFSLNGLPGIDFFVPGTSPFSATETDTTVTRLYTTPQPLARNATTETRSASAGLSGDTSGWRWSLNGNYSEVESHTLTDRSLDSAVLEAMVTAGLVDPFDPATGRDLRFVQPDLSDSLNSTADVTGEASGALLDLPAGEVRLSLNGGYNRQDISGVATRSGDLFPTDLGRGAASVGGNISLPVSSRREGVLDAIGDLTLNANAGYKHLTDFGDLKSYGGGFTWAPTENLRILFSYIGEEAAPSVSDLGAPIILTPNVPIFDFTTGQSVLIDRTTGGNPGLIAESRGDIKFNIGWEPGFLEDFRIEAEYDRNRSSDVTNAFPLLTPSIEAAFPDRVTRGANGTLLALDARPVTFSEVNSERIRWGINYRGEFGGSDEAEGSGGGGGRYGRGSGAGAGGDGARGGRGRRSDAAASDEAPPQTDAAPAPPQDGAPAEGQTPPAAAAQTQGGDQQQVETPRARGGGGRRGGGGVPGFGRGEDGKGRWNVSLYHTYTLQDEVVIRPELGTLDLLDGDAIGASGGSPRHQIELEGGVFYKGIGLRLSGNYASATRVNGDALTGSSDLFFGDLATFDLRLFANLEQVIADEGFWKGTRVSLRVDNLFGAIQNVRGEDGNTPLRYQPGFVDPVGRYVEVDFRKRF
ncbi:hypothetical protein [Novosphingopyxis sp.]|uniref:hypothetical protein n=1 Tax=Novosphingopyxis sp. TaxID=2709690 RepID=UPI003B5C4C1A